MTTEEILEALDAILEENDQQRGAIIALMRRVQAGEAPAKNCDPDVYSIRSVRDSAGILSPLHLADHFVRVVGWTPERFARALKLLEQMESETSAAKK